MKLAIENNTKVESESSFNPPSAETCRTNIYSSLEEFRIQDNSEKYKPLDTPDQIGCFALELARWRIYCSALK